MVEAVRGLGARSRVPSLWLYGDNDPLVPATTWRAMHAAYAAGGAPADVVAYGRFRDDARQLRARSDARPRRRSPRSLMPDGVRLSSSGGPRAWTGPASRSGEEPLDLRLAFEEAS
ncbi:hypothetical protein [Methylobacterium platani]|uniref:Peptidase S9 prolyl oligopeptidase catalytic domain-containing protein n=1 Tax=Methylobacterium platani TaxID=427683 RepID=A0A179SES7_9HYPH|nr:hypothetical protein [Methylobacterium platani]OAS25472.1 hypothetical protein A5481_08900 [Methylobacterium platani]